MSAHTPGPWEAIDTAPGTTQLLNAGRAAAIVHVYPTNRAEEQEAAANVRLIAAAPDLLEAARDIEAFLASLDKAYGIHKRDGYDKLRAAISKAEGGQS